MTKPKSQRAFKGKGNQHNRVKRDAKTLSAREKEIASGRKEFPKLRWQNG